MPHHKSAYRELREILHEADECHPGLLCLAEMDEERTRLLSLIRDLSAWYAQTCADPRNDSLLIESRAVLELDPNDWSCP